MNFLKVFGKEQTRSLIDEFPYWDIVDGVMILKNGRAEAGVSIDLLPSLFMPPLSQIVNMNRVALRSTPEGTRTRFVTLVGRANRSRLDEYKRISNATEEVVTTLTEGRYDFLNKLRHEGEITEWRSFMSVGFGGGRSDRQALSSIELSQMLRRAERINLRLARFLDQTGFHPKPLSTQDVFELTHRYLNPTLAGCDLGTYRSTEQNYPRKAVKQFPGLRPPTLRAQLLKSEIDNSHRDYLVVGEHHIKMIAMHTIPDETFESMGNILLRAGHEFAVVVDVQHEPHAKALRKIKDANRRNSATVSQDEIYVDADVDEGLSEGRELVRHLKRSGDHIYRVSLCVVMMSRDLKQLEETTQSVLSNLAEVPGNPFRPLGQGVFHPWRTVAPFSGDQYEEFVDLVETSAAHMLPINGPWPGSRKPVAMYHTRYKTLAAIDTFESRNKNAHALFLGGTRTGKTFTAQFQLSETLRDQSVDAVIIDRGLSWKRLVEAFDGVIIPVETGGKVSVNPFELEIGELQPDEEQKGFLHKLLRTMVPSDGGAREADEDAILISSIEEAYDSALSEVSIDGVFVKTFEPFLLRDFINTLLTLSAVGDRPVTDTEREIASSLARRLQLWAGDTPLGRFIDRPTTLPEADARVVLYETRSFNNQPKFDAVGTMLIQRAVWRRATRHKDRRMVLATDEAWAVLKNPYAVEFLVEMLRRGAREGIAVWLLNQTIEDIKGKVGVLQALTSFYLFQLPGEASLIQEILKLDDNVMEDYTSLTGRKGEYNEFLFYSQREDSREGEVLKLITSPTDYWTFTNHHDDLAKLDKATKQYGSEQAAIRALASQGTI